MGCIQSRTREDESQEKYESNLCMPKDESEEKYESDACMRTEEKHESNVWGMGTFDQLPDHLIPLIFEKFDDDLKFLCQCLLVSKNFALNIYSVKTVSLHVPLFLKQCSDEWRIFDEMFSVKGVEITEVFKSLISLELTFCKTLQKFKELKTISVEFTCPVSPCNPLVKWGIISRRRNGTIFERFILFRPDNLRVLIHNACLSISYLSKWIAMAFLLLKLQPSVECVTLTDSHKHGKFVLRGDQLFEWRNSMHSHNFTITKSKMLLLPGTGQHFSVLDVMVSNEDDYGCDTWNYFGEEGLLFDFAKVLGDIEL